MNDQDKNQSRSDQSGRSTADLRVGDRGELKHTPGPWEVVRHSHAENELWLSVNQHADAEGMKHWIAEIKYRTAAEPQQWADAHLLAAAPDLYEACKRALAFKGGVGELRLMCARGESDRECVNRHTREVAEMLEAAIAKAEGREP